MRITAGHCSAHRWDTVTIGAICDKEDNCGQYFEEREGINQFRHPNYYVDDNAGTVEEWDLRLVQLNEASSITPVDIDDGTLSNTYVAGEADLDFYLILN
jgi:hypothetical protein